jgi:hypothetical protein
MIAERLVNELMLVSVLVAGEGAAAFSEKLEAAGAAAEILADAPPAGFDLAILLASPDSAGDDAMSARIAALSGASDRLLFAPLPLRDSAEAGAQGTLPLNDWFELFAEHGYQPVVDFDADFVAAGAFLVDRQATAAESELAAFADRLQHPAPAASREMAARDERAGEAERDALRAEIAALQAEIAALTVLESAREADIAAPVTDASGWEALVPWVNGVVADPRRNAEALLRQELPRLLELRGADAPAFTLEKTPPAPLAPRKSWLRRLFGTASPPAPLGEPAILADIALVRASRFFDPAWYIASTPELLAGEALDPVFHYMLVGAVRGADPGPWFNTAEYLAAHPQVTEEGTNPLVQAIRSGEAERMMAAHAQ